MKINICFLGMEPGGKRPTNDDKYPWISAKGVTWPERDREDFTNKITSEMDPAG